MLVAGLLCAAFCSAASATQVTCSNSSADPGAVQSAVDGGGTVTLNGHCNFSSAQVTINNAVTLNGGAAASINGNGNGGGTALTINADNVTIHGITFDNGLSAAAVNGFIRQHFVFTGNTVQNTFGNSNGAMRVYAILRYSLIDSNHFLSIAPKGFASATYASLGFNSSPSCYYLPGQCDVAGGDAIVFYNGTDNTDITNNVVDLTGGDFIHAFWSLVGEVGSPFPLAQNVRISYNKLSRIHRIGLEVQGAAGGCGTAGCDYNRLWVTNLQINGNYFHDAFLPYAPNYAFSLVPTLASGTILNNSAICNYVQGNNPCGTGFEDGWHINTMQGNVITADIVNVLGGNYKFWGNGQVYAGNGAPANPPAHYTTQNNYFCSTSVEFQLENAYGGTLSATTQYNYQRDNGPCANQGHLTTPAIDFSLVSANTKNLPALTWTYSAVSTLSIKWVQYFLDGSTTPLATQELSDVNGNFANDVKWLYHQTLDTTGMPSGPHTLTAVATDVSGATQTVTQSFTVADGGSVGAASPVVSPKSVVFPSTAVGVMSAPGVITLSNSGTAPFSLSAVSISGTNAADFNEDASACGSSVAAGASCAIKSMFTPAAAGSRYAVLNIVTSAGSLQVPLSGIGATVVSSTAITQSVQDPQSFLWDAGGSQWGGAFLQVYQNYGSKGQSFTWTPTGTAAGQYTVCSLSICLSDNGSQVLMSSKADVFSMTKTGAVLDVTTGRYVQNPSSPVNGSFLSTGSVASAWTFSGNGAPPPPTITRTAADAQGMFWDAGGAQWGGQILQVYQNFPSKGQDFTWTPTGTKAPTQYTVCSGSICLSDNGKQVAMGSKADVWTITSTGAVLDVTTGHYIENPSSPANGSDLSTGSTPDVWLLSATLH